jgi:hypothetical protein
MHLARFEFAACARHRQWEAAAPRVSSCVRTENERRGGTTPVRLSPLPGIRVPFAGVYPRR